MKKNRQGKAAIFKDIDIKKIRKAFSVPQHRCIFEMALYTGERMGAIVQLKVSDVYQASAIPQEMITFRASTRKARPDGTRETRQVPIHADLRSYLESYICQQHTGWLFTGHTSTKHISYDSVYQYWKNKFLELGMDHRGFSTHSTRRWFITRLVRNGTDIKTVQAITGHKNMNVLLGYVEADPEVIKNAVANISV